MSRVVRRAVRRADLHRAVDLRLVGVDRDDGARARVQGALDRGRAETAATDNSDDVTRLHAPAVDGGAEAGRDSAREQRGRAKVVPRLDTDHRCLVDDDVLGERSHVAHAIQVRVAEVMSPRTVRDHRAGERARGHVTDIRAPGDAVLTLPARRDERRRDVVAGLDRRHALADRVDDAGTLVTADDREHRRSGPRSIRGPLDRCASAPVCRCWSE